MSASRAQFITENAPELLRALSALSDDSPIRYSYSSSNMTGGRLSALVKSLAGATEPEFLLVCNCIVQQGHYVLFGRILDQRLVDCQSLESFSGQLHADRLPTVIESMRRSRQRQRSLAAPAQLSEGQLDFLRRHASTTRRILRVEPPFFELLQFADVLAAEEAHHLRGLPPEESSRVLVDRIVSQSTSPALLYRFCHALLITGQYRLYSILHGIIDAKLNFSSPKGLALIINNFDFRYHSQRHGTAVDVRNLTNLLGQLGYRVLPPCQDLTAAKIREQARRFVLCPDHERMHSCVVVVLSHGEYDSIVGVDGALLSNFEFFSIFNARNAPLLAGKPRIFIMQACRGALHDNGVERLLAADEPDAGLLRWRSPPSGRNKPFRLGNDSKSPRKSIIYGNDRDSPKQSDGIFARIGVRLGWSTPRGAPSAVIVSSSNEQTATVGSSKAEKSHTGRSLRQFFPEPLHPQDLSVPSSPPTNSLLAVRRVHEPTDSDMLIAYATTPNYVSWRNSERGTWFVQAICEVFSRHAKHEDILTMLTRRFEVNHYVASKFNSSCGGNKQIPEYTNRLRRKFYFFPGWSYEQDQNQSMSHRVSSA